MTTPCAMSNGNPSIQATVHPVRRVSRSLAECRRLLRLTSLAWLMLPLSLAQPQAASAQSSRFALTCVGTETGYTIPFTYRWGNSGQWRSASVEPGRWVKLMWNYDYAGENRSPQLKIRYDDNTTGSINIVNTPLNSYAASSSNCEDQGKTYNFYQRGNELYVQEED